MPLALSVTVGKLLKVYASVSSSVKEGFIKKGFPMHFRIVEGIDGLMQVSP